MATIDLDRQQYRHLTDLLAVQAELLNIQHRQTLLERAGLSQFIPRLNFDVEPRIFASQVVRVLQNYGTLQDTGQPALVSLLKELREILAGHGEEAAFLDVLLAPYTEGNRSPASLPTSTRGAIRLLFLSSNPQGTDSLRLMQEARTIQERLSEGGNRFDFITALAVRQSDLSRLLLQHRPQLVHFSGHGTSAGEIVVEDERGDLFPLPPEVLGDLFRILGDNTQGVVINACWSERQASAIVQHVPIVVGLTRQIGDQAAIAFAAGFYRGLAFGQSIRTAFDLACNEVAMVSLWDREVPRLLVRNDVNASQLRLE